MARDGAGPISTRLNPRLAALNSERCPADSAFRFSYSFQRNFKTAVAREARELLSPLYQQDAGGSDQVIKCEGFKFALGVDAVEIDVIEGGARGSVFVDEREGGAGYVFGAGGIEALGDAFD